MKIHLRSVLKNSTNKSEIRTFFCFNVFILSQGTTITRNMDMQISLIRGLGK
jgi:hypothetical protein